MLRAIRLARGLGVITIGTIGLLLAAESVSGAANSGSKVIVKSGKGFSSSISTSTSSNGKTGDCSQVRLIVVSAAIDNGGAGNTITVNANCNGVPVATATATEGGDEFVYDVQEGPFTGALTCDRLYAETVAMSPDSNWTITCVFLF